MKRIPITNKSRKKKVDVKVIPSDAVEETPTPPKDYEANLEEDVWNDNDSYEDVNNGSIIEDLDEVFDDEEDQNEPLTIKDSKSQNKSLFRKHLAEDLASLEPEEMRKVIRAAKHLQKFVRCLKDDDDNFQDAVDDLWREK